MTDYTFEQYLDYDQTSLSKNEFVRGDIKAMPGGTLKHGLLTNRLSSSFNPCADQNDYLITSPDVRLYIPICKLSAYPDMMIFCDPPKFYEDKRDVLLNPAIVGEVLSKSTERYDRETKFPCYITVPSVSTVILVNQDIQRIEVYRRETEWEMESYDTGDLKVKDCTVNVERIYRNTDF